MAAAGGEEPNAKRPRVVLKHRRGEAPPNEGPAARPATPAGVANAGEPAASLRAGPGDSATAQAQRRASSGPAARAPDAQSTAVFEVGGQLFKVPAQIILARPTTLLAQLVAGNAGGEENASPAGGGRAIFVDGAVERFTCILDWYRYNEIHVPASVPVAALLQDARRFQLPERIVVNGIWRSTQPDVGQKVARDLVEGVLQRWPGFRPFFEDLLGRIRAHYQAAAESSAVASAGTPAPAAPPAAVLQGRAALNGTVAAGSVNGTTAAHARLPPPPAQEHFEGWDFPPFVLPIYGEQGWVNPQQVCSAARARVLALQLEERGFLCDFTEVELVVSLPLLLRGEMGGAPPEEEEFLEDADGGQGLDNGEG